MSNIYSAGPTHSWQQEEEEKDDQNVTRELTAAHHSTPPSRASSPEQEPPADSPDRWRQDTQPVDGEAAIHPPPGGARPQG